VVKSKTEQPGLIEFTKRVSLKPFPYKVVIIVTSDVNRSVLNRPALVGEHEPHPKIIAMRCEDIRGKGISYLFLPFKLVLSDVAHESYHAVRSMLRYIGAESEEEEVVAYHLDHLVNAAYKHLNDSINKRNKLVLPLPSEVALAR
jgi:hypothetical protein